MALEVQPTTTRGPVSQWLNDRRTMPLYMVLGTVLGIGLVAICDALSISLNVLCFGLLMLVIGHYGPQVLALLRSRILPRQR